jgi:hypothetical protein
MSATGTAYPYGLPGSVEVTFTDGTKVTASLVDAASALKVFGSINVINGLQAIYDAGVTTNGVSSVSVDGKQIASWGSMRHVGGAGRLYIEPDGARYLMPSEIQFIITPPSTTPTLTPPTGAPGTWYLVGDANGNELWQTSDHALAYAYIQIYGGSIAASNGQWPNVGVRNA